MVKTLGTATHSQHQNFKYSAPFAGNKRVWATVCQPFKFFDQMKTKQKIIKCLKGSYKGTDIFVSLNAGRLRRKPKFENMYLYTIKSIYIIFQKKKSSNHCDFNNDPVVVTVYSKYPYGLNQSNISSSFWQSSSRWAVRAKNYLDVPTLARQAPES